MNWTIFKRQKPTVIMPEPKFEDNWKQKQYEKNVKEGVLALQKGKTIKIMDDGRGYELALEIKHQFILEYQRQLAEKIKIDGVKEITISLQNNMI
jgi:hypothetical protein